MLKDTATVGIQLTEANHVTHRMRGTVAVRVHAEPVKWERVLDLPAFCLSRD